MSYWVIISQSEVAQIKILRLIFQDECHLSRNISKFYSNITDQVKLKKIIILKIIQEECHSSKGWIKSYIEEDPHFEANYSWLLDKKKNIAFWSKAYFLIFIKAKRWKPSHNPSERRHRLYLLVLSRNILITPQAGRCNCACMRDKIVWVLSNKITWSQK